MEGKFIRAGLGQIAALGDLYDVRSDSFCGISVLKKELPKSAIKSTDNHSTDTQFIHTDSFSEKLTKLDVKAELKLSVLAGLLSLDGAGKYLKDEKSSARAVRSTLLYSIGTKVDQLNIYHEDLKQCLSTDAVGYNEATHVVVEIFWGANSIASVEYKNEEGHDIKKIEGYLGTEMSTMAHSISGNGDVKFEEGAKSGGMQYTFKMFGDVLPSNGNIPQTFQQALALMKNMPTLVKSANNGKGKPLSYGLLPIGTLRKYLSLPTVESSLVKKLNEDHIVRFVVVFDEITSVKQQLNDLSGDMRAFSYCLSDSDLSSISATKMHFEEKESMLKTKLAQLLVEVRSGKKATTTIEALRNEYLGENYSAAKVRLILDKFTAAREKIVLAKLLKTSGVRYVARGGSVDSVILESGNSDIYILYYGKALVENQVKLWTETRQLFLNLAKEHQAFRTNKTTNARSVFVFVDGDFAPKLIERKTAPNISMLKNGRCLMQDVLQNQRREATLCYVQSTDMLTPTAIPKITFPLTLRCPGSITGNCPNDKVKWVCHKCKTDIGFGLDAGYYCPCGRGLYSTFKYKCCSDKHGSTFLEFSGDTVDDLLYTLIPTKYSICFELDMLMEVLAIGLKSTINTTAVKFCERQGERHESEPNESSFPQLNLQSMISAMTASLSVLPVTSCKYFEEAITVGWYIKCKNPSTDVMKTKIIAKCQQNPHSLASPEHQKYADVVAATLQAYDTRLANVKKKSSPQDVDLTPELLTEKLEYFGQLPKAGSVYSLAIKMFLLKIKEKKLPDVVRCLKPYKF